MTKIVITLDDEKKFPETEMEVFKREYDEELEMIINFLNNDKEYKYITIPYKDKFLLATI